MQGVEPLTSALLGKNSTTRPPWQVRLKGVKVCGLEKACPIICNLAVDSEFCLFRKKSNTNKYKDTRACFCLVFLVCEFFDELVTSCVNVWGES